MSQFGDTTKFSRKGAIVRPLKNPVECRTHLTQWESVVQKCDALGKLQDGIIDRARAS